MENTLEQLARLEKEVERLRMASATSERERTEYLQNVAHQIVAPLNAMKWHIENLTSNRVSVERAKKVLRSIYSQATIAVHLAKNFALMSNLEADHALTTMREPLEEVDLKSLLINLADDFQPLGWDKEVNITVDDTRFKPVRRVLAMKALISQVFSNVIENAVKYSNQSSDILITADMSADGQSVEVAVASIGIPVAVTDTDAIFGRGFRSDLAKTRYPAGTGFGLYIARKIMDVHEGSIRAEATGPRTTFVVTLSVKGLQGKARQWPGK